MSTTTTPAQRRRAYQGLAILSYSFRPFFLLGAIYAGLAILVWLPVFHGELVLHSAFAPRDWHVHEMLFGYLPAVMTGFLFTAIPNWTCRLPIQGKPLPTLVLVWIAGRVAVRREITPMSCRSAHLQRSGGRLFGQPAIRSARQSAVSCPGGAGCGRSVMCPGRKVQDHERSSMATPHVAGLAAFQTHSKLELPAVSKSWVTVRRRATVVRNSEFPLIAIPRCTKR